MKEKVFHTRLFKKKKKEVLLKTMIRQEPALLPVRTLIGL